MQNQLKKSLVGAMCAGAMAVALLPGAAEAQKPLSVDCSVLESSLVAADAILDGSGTSFASLGELVSTSKKNPALFGQLAGLLAFVSGGQVAFTDAREVVPTVAKCGLVPTLNALIAD